MTERGTLRVVLADDQTVVREGLVTLLGLLPGVEVVGAAADGVAATRQVRADHPHTEVVVLTTYADDDSVLGALQAGARGFLTKDADAESIARALHAAAAGQSTVDGDVLRRLIEAAARAQPASARGR